MPEQDFMHCQASRSRRDRRRVQQQTASPDSECFKGRGVRHYGASLRHQQSCDIGARRMVQRLSSLHVRPDQAIACRAPAVKL